MGAEVGLLEGEGAGTELGLEGDIGEGVKDGLDEGDGGCAIDGEGIAVGVEEGIDEGDGGCTIEGLLEAGEGLDVDDGLGLGELVEPMDWSNCSWFHRSHSVSLKGDGY